MLVEPIIIDDLYKGREARFYDTVSPTIRSRCAGLKVAIPYQIQNNMEFKGKNINNGDGLYLSTSSEFFRGGLDKISRTLKANVHDAGVCIGYRIRKLTPRECFRLMGVSDENIDKIVASGVSKSQQYKLAGNSICTDVMVHLFKNLFCTSVDETNKEPVVLQRPRGWLNLRVVKGYSPSITKSQWESNNVLAYPAEEINTYMGIRKLTPRECFRLMGVSDENIDKIIQSEICKTRLYVLAGNSIVVDVMTYIFAELFKHRLNENVKFTPPHGK